MNLVNNILLDLGVIKIYWYSFFIFLALYIGGSLAMREGKKWRISEDFMVNLFFFLIPFSIIGARIYYVIFNWSYYKLNIIEIFKIWEGGLAIHGGIILGIIWIIIYTKKYKVSTLRVMDILSVSLLIGQAIGRWGNFFNGEAHGPATTAEALKKFIPLDFIVEGMNINGTYYQPTFLYESLFCLLGFIILLIIRRRKYIKIGQTTSLYFIIYGIGRYFIEGLRTDSLMLNNMKMAQIVSIGLVLTGIIMFFVCGRGAKLENRYNDMDNTNEVNF